jgi:hypothetical protein
MPRPKGPERRRVQVTLSAETWALVEEVSELTGQPKAQLLAEIFDEALPAIRNTMEALRIVKQQPREAQRLMQNFAAGAVMQMSQAQLDLDAHITAKERKRRKKRGTDGAT